MAVKGKNFDKVKADYQNNAQPNTVYSPPDEETLNQLAAMQKGRNNALVLPSDKLVIRGCEISPVGMAIPENLGESDWIFVAQSIAKLQASLQWIIGDLWVFALRQYGDREDLAESVGKKPKTLSNWASVCRAFPDQSSRQRELSFTHHAEVAGREDAQELLQRAVSERLSVPKLREIVYGKQLAPGKVERYGDRISRMVSYGKSAKDNEKQRLIEFLKAALEELIND